MVLVAGCWLRIFQPAAVASWTTLIGGWPLPPRFSPPIQRLPFSAASFAAYPLFDAELPALMRWLAVRNRWRDADSDWLFLSQKGGALSRHQVRLLLKRYGELAGVSISAYPHMLRHGCGYALADLGRDTRLIQDYLGHRNIRHTVIYTATNTQRFMNVWGNMRENHTISARM
ncbi:tyrosine-type recombinase/integrase [Escherichia coli]